MARKRNPVHVFKLLSWSLMFLCCGSGRVLVRTQEEVKDDSQKVRVAIRDWNRALSIRGTMGQDTRTRAAAVCETHLKRCVWFLSSVTLLMANALARTVCESQAWWQNSYHVHSCTFNYTFTNHWETVFLSGCLKCDIKAVLVLLCSSVKYTSWLSIQLCPFIFV